MAHKLKEYEQRGTQRLFVFHCPGCGYDHPFHTGGDPATRPQWDWNGSLERPTFTPSLVVFKDNPVARCHLFMTDGNIQFLDDCFHNLAGKTVPVPDYEA